MVMAAGSSGEGCASSDSVVAGGTARLTLLEDVLDVLLHPLLYVLFVSRLKHHCPYRTGRLVVHSKAEAPGRRRPTGGRETSSTRVVRPGRFQALFLRARRNR